MPQSMSLTLDGRLRDLESKLRKLNARRKAVEQSKRDDDWKEDMVEKIEARKTILQNRFNKRYNMTIERRREAQEQAAIRPTLDGKEQVAAVRQFNDAGYPATAKLIGSLPAEPGRDFMERLNA